MKKCAILLPLLLTGCGLTARTDARIDYQVSVATYKTCLAESAGQPQRCEAQRLTMEADERKYNNISAGMGGRQGSANITVLNR